MPWWARKGGRLGGWAVAGAYPVSFAGPGGEPKRLTKRLTIKNKGLDIDDLAP